MDTQPSDQKRHIRQALADLVFGLALFAIFILLGVFGAKQASSYGTVVVESAQTEAAQLPKGNQNGVLLHLALPLPDET